MVRSWFLSLAWCAALGCSSSTSTAGGAPAQVVVTLLQPPAVPTIHAGFPVTLPRGASTLQVSALDSTGRAITLDAARYRFDVIPAAVPGLYALSPATNTTLGVAVLTTGTVSVTWRLTDLNTSRVIIGPTVTNVLLQ